MVIKIGLCQTDNKFVPLRPLFFLTNSLPARNYTGFGRWFWGLRDKTAGQIQAAAKTATIPDVVARGIPKEPGILKRSFATHPENEGEGFG